METVVKPIVLTLPQKNYVMEGVVNGLIATAIIWVFWVPFLIAVVVPVSSAIIKRFICSSISNGVAPGKGLFPQSQKMAKDIIRDDPKEITIENQFHYSSFVILALLVIPTSLFFANYIINVYNLDRVHIVFLNIIMFFVISAIEGIFFVAIATRYTPWNINEVLNYVSNYIKRFPNE